MKTTCQMPVREQAVKPICGTSLGVSALKPSANRHSKSKDGAKRLKVPSQVSKKNGSSDLSWNWINLRAWLGVSAADLAESQPRPYCFVHNIHYAKSRMGSRSALTGNFCTVWNAPNASAPTADALVTPEGHRFQAGDLAWWSLAIRQAEAFRVLSRKQREMRGGPGAAASTDGRQDGMEADALAPVASALMRQVRSGPSSLPDREISSEARRETQQGQPKARATVCKQTARRILSGKPALSTQINEGDRGSLGLTPKNRPKSAARRTGGAA